jgi:hypothetical protein
MIQMWRNLNLTCLNILTRPNKNQH